MLSFIVLAVLSADPLGAPSELLDQDNPIRISRYYADAACSGDRDALLFLTDHESLKDRPKETGRSLLNAYAARLARGACKANENDRSNQKATSGWNVPGQDISAVRLTCANGKFEDLKLRKVGKAWKVVVPPLFE